MIGADDMTTRGDGEAGFAVYVADKPGPVDTDDGVCSTCVAVFGDVEDAIAEASARVRDGYSVSIDIGVMTPAEWDALEEVPDDFAFAPPATPAVDPPAESNTGNPSTRGAKGDDT